MRENRDGTYRHAAHIYRDEFPGKDVIRSILVLVADEEQAVVVDRTRTCRTTTTGVQAVWLARDSNSCASLVVSEHGRIDRALFDPASHAGSVS